MSIQTINPYQNNTNYYNKTVTSPNFQGAESNQVNTSTKTGMSTGSKWAVGIGLTALAAVGIYLATKGKVKPEAFKEIQFQEAKTVEEAKKFAKDNFGVTYENIDDVSCINFLNEWITKISKNGKNKKMEDYPRFISKMPNEGYDIPFALYDEPMEYKGIKGYLLGVNTEMFNDFPKAIDCMLKGSENVIKKIKGKFYLSNDAGVYNTDFVKKFIEKINNVSDKTSFKEKMQIITDLSRINQGEPVKGKIKEANFSVYLTLNHELGHLKHQILTKDYSKMKKIIEYEEKNEPVSKITQEFINSKEIQDTASKVSDYSKESPLEFVAETYARLLDGQKFDDDVMALYKKYHGPEV